MTIHREGYQSIGIGALIFGVLNVASFTFLSASLPWLTIIIFVITLGLLLFLISFFRIPNRTLTINDQQLICPADGKVVVIEEVIDEEYFKDKRIQVSIFMSPANVHVNRNPMSGEVVYNQYHGTILYKQIAGALAKRICNYTTVGQQVKQCDEYGFIKFGSRVDILLPVGTKVNVSMNQVVKGGVTVLASWQ
jgi:phosphatidylserine decarboxylase